VWIEEVQARDKRLWRLPLPEEEESMIFASKTEETLCWLFFLKGMLLGVAVIVIVFFVYHLIGGL